MEEPIYSLMKPEFSDDPIRAYGGLREKAPIVRVGHAGGPPIWLITRWEEMKNALSDSRLVVDRSKVPGQQGANVVEQLAEAIDLPDEVRDFGENNMMFRDGAEHARLRRLVTPAFSVRRIKALRPRIEGISTALLEELARKGSGDLIEEYSSPLTAAVICELIGIDEADQPQMRQWMHEYANGDRATCARGMVACIKELIKRRRTEPADDMITTLVQTSDEDGDRLSEAEMIELVLLLVNAGFHSTSHFIPNSVLVLFDNPDQLALLRARPESLPHALDELIRIANPIPTATPRYATEDMEIAGVSVSKGDALTGSMFAANFDPRVFPDPGKCDVARVTKRGEGHLTFGGGPHYCIGAALARLELEIALDHLLIQRDSLEITVSREKLEYIEVYFGLQLLSELPVRL